MTATSNIATALSTRQCDFRMHRNLAIRPRVLASRRVETSRTSSVFLTQATSERATWRPKLIASDVDGTLLNSKQELTDRVRDAVIQAADSGIPLVIATGKARGPWAEQVLPKLGNTTPGVYLQGCLIYNGNGELIHRRDLEDSICRDVIEFAKEHGLTLVAYCGERILTEVTDEQTDRLLFYNDPPPESMGPLDKILGDIPVQKMIFMAEQSRIDQIRPLVEELMAGRASLTTALSGMLEVLPLGVSKGDGVHMLLDMLGVDPADVMAIGDGENDIEMLELAGLGVAMGNAGPKALEASDAVVASNDEDGVAEAIHKFVLEPSAAPAAKP